MNGTCGPKGYRCYSPPASGNVARCPLHEAAPEMYEALQKLLTRWDTAGLGRGDEPLIESCRVALAQACGESTPPAKGES